jgi:hypothetical protein
MDDQGTVRALLDAAGLHPPAEDMDALMKAYSQMRHLAGLLFAVEETRYELPALSFQPDPAGADERS